MPLFPLFVQLEGRVVLVVGGGDVAARKIEALLQAGARVQVHTHSATATVLGWIDEGRIVRLDGTFDPCWLDDAWLVVAATDDRGFNTRLAEEARHRRVFANVVDDAELSTFHVPAIVDRSPLQVAISSGGAAPMLARRLRERLEVQLDASLGELAALFARHRDKIRDRLPHLSQRRRWFEQVMDGPVSTLLQAGERAAAGDLFQDMLQRGPDAPRAGSVTLVGTGNGDPGLLTLKALRAMNQADLLLHDGVGADVLAMARRDAPRQSLPRDPSLVDLLDRHVRSGARVVCLKPGDAFRTSPDDSLPRALAERGVACEVIAGIV